MNDTDLSMVQNDLNNPNANPNSAGAFCVYKVVTFKNKKNDRSRTILIRTRQNGPSSN